jgi:hypothetical protein
VARALNNLLKHVELKPETSVRADGTSGQQDGQGGSIPADTGDPAMLASL